VFKKNKNLHKKGEFKEHLKRLATALIKMLRASLRVGTKKGHSARKSKVTSVVSGSTVTRTITPATSKSMFNNSQQMSNNIPNFLF